MNIWDGSKATSTLNTPATPNTSVSVPSLNAADDPPGSFTVAAPKPIVMSIDKFKSLVSLSRS